MILENYIKIQNQSNTKNLSELIYVFLGNIKVEKYLSITFFIEWNLLTPKSTILVAEIGVKDDVFSLSLESSDFLYPFSN